MLADNPLVYGLSQRHLRNWWELAIPPGMTGAPRVLLIALRQGKPFHACLSGGEVVPLETLDYRGHTAAQLATLRRQQGANAVFVADETYLSRLLDAMDQSVVLRDSFADQALGLWNAARVTDGMWSDPPVRELIPPLSRDALSATLQLLIPDRRAVFAYVIDEGQSLVHASVLAVKERGVIATATMHPAIEAMCTEREVVRLWRTDRRRIHDAIGRELALPALGVFVSLKALREILSGPPEQFATELRAGNLVFDPCPAWLKGLLGGAQMASAATKGARVVSGFLPASARQLAGNVAGAARQRVKDVGPFAALGFDPIELLQRVRGYYR